MNEKNIMAKLHHPFLPRLYGTFQDEACIFMLMDLVRGGELERRIRQSGKLPEDDACFYAACTHEALAHMHHRGIVYRDLKPSTQEYRIVVCLLIGLPFSVLPTHTMFVS